MKTPNEFESFLTAQPFRPLPLEWRQEILDAANAGKATRKRHRAIAFLVRPRNMWAALAAVWLVLAVLHFNTPPAPTYGGPLPRPTAAAVERQFARRQAETAALLALLAPTFPLSPGTPARTSSSSDVL